MLGEIITTFAGASLVIGVALTDGASQHSEPRSPFSSSQWSQEAHVKAAPPLKRSGMITGQGCEGGPSPGESSLLSGPAEGFMPSEPPNGLVAGLIISADVLVGNNDTDRHMLTVRPADSGREFKGKVVGMAKEGPGPGDQALASPDSSLARLSGAPAAERWGIGRTPPSKIRI